MIDRKSFYSALRKRESGVFGTSLSKRQVTALDEYLNESGTLPIDDFAHVLGEVYHETQGGMYPVKETVFINSSNKNPTDAQVIARLDRAFAKGQLTWVRKPYWRDGAFGRGGIQLTHWSNYDKLSPVVGVDLRRNPEKALDPVISARIAIEGCRLGLFTGKKLADFRGIPYDHYNARAIVNGDKVANGKKVKEYALAFKRALKVAGYVGNEATEPTINPRTPPKTAPQAPKRPKVGAGAAVGAIAVAGGGALAVWWDKIANWFGG